MCRRLLRQALLCVIHSIFYDKVCLLYTYRIRSTQSQTWSQINIPIIWFLNLFNSKKGHYIFERHKNWDCDSSNCKKKSTKKPIFISYFGRQLSLKQCGTLVVKRVCLPQIRAAAKLKWVYLCCCGWIYSLTSFEVIVHIGKGGGYVVGEGDRIQSCVHNLLKKSLLTSIVAS